MPTPDEILAEMERFRAVQAGHCTYDLAPIDVLIGYMREWFYVRSRMQQAFNIAVEEYLASPGTVADANDSSPKT